MSERIKCTECEYYDATPTTLIIRGKRVKAKGWCTRDDCILNEGRYAEVGRIVRCKDCKYSREAMPMVKGQYECGYVLGVRTADDFCSRGEKNEINRCR